MDRSRIGFRRPAHGVRRASGARAEEGMMTVETRDTEFRHPEAVAFLRSLTDEEAVTHPLLVRVHDDVATHYWRKGGRVCCREAARETPDTPEGTTESDDPGVHGRTRPTRRIPAVKTAAAARNPEALVRPDDLRADAAALLGLQKIRYGR